jgi:hypothetical protein
MRYSLVKVLLTVSPFRPSFSPPLNLFPRSPRAISPLSTAFTPNRSLTPLSTAFTQTHRGVGVSLRQLSALCVSALSVAVISLALCFHNLMNCFSRNPFIFTTIRIARACHPLWPRCSGLSALCVALFSGAVCFQQLAASFFLFALFLHTRAFVFNSLQPLFQNTRGMGIPDASAGHPGVGVSPDGGNVPDLQTFRRSDVPTFRPADTPLSPLCYHAEF